MSDRFQVTLAWSRGAITRALAIEVAQRGLVDVADREKQHGFLHREAIGIEIRDVDE